MADSQKSNMTTFYLDTEFNSFGGDLISLALVSQDLEVQFYEVLPWAHLNLHPWVETNVIPVLFKNPYGSKLDAQRKLAKFLTENAVDNEITIVADWPEDIKHLCDFLLTGPGTCLSIPNIIMIIDRVNLPSTTEYSLTPHNALEDAKALARWTQKP
jgi:hypothetical protein